MGKTLNEIILMNDNLTGCLPPQIGLLKEVIIFYVSFNNLQGSLPPSIGSMKKVDQLDIAAKSRFVTGLRDPKLAEAQSSRGA